jgi:glutamine cyclotransferase
MQRRHLVLILVILLGGSSGYAFSTNVPVYSYKLINAYPHDRTAYTQGLAFENGFIYEGTGLYGKSSLRKADLKTGKVLQRHAHPIRYFGEGITVLNDKIFQVTWRSRVAFVYDRDSFRLLNKFSYDGQGWGITHNGSSLIMSDGTATLRFLDPQTFREISRIEVTDGNRPVTGLNELEYVRGEVYANVWKTDQIVRITADTGRVVGWIDLHGLLDAKHRDQPVDVLNGIAYDPEQDRLFVTGKLWPKLFEIKLVPKK